MSNIPCFSVSSLGLSRKPHRVGRKNQAALPGVVPLVGVWLGLAGTLWGASADVVFVDPQISETYATNYDSAGRTCADGIETAYDSLRSAAATTEPGTTVFLRGGVYREQLNPLVSGTPTQPITFQVYTSRRQDFGFA